MKTINQFIITVGLLLGSLAVWADDAAEKASLEKYFSWRGTNYIDVIALAEENQALRDSVNTLYKNSFAVIDTVGGEYIFQGFITLDGVAPTLPKVDTLYISEEAATYLGTGAMTVQTTFMSIRPAMIDELKKCLGTQAPKRMLPNIEPADPIFGTLPYRVDGINYALSGGMTCLIQKLMRGDDIEITKCMLNSDIYFKAAAKLMEAFQTTDLYNKAIAKPLIYEVPLAKAKRLEFLSRDTIDYLHFVTLKDSATIQLNKEWNVPLDIRLEYSFDRKVWKNYAWTGTQGDSILLPNTNDTVWLRAGGDTHLNATFNTDNNDAVFTFGANDSIAAGGNIMSLLDASCVQDTVPNHAFYRLFKNATQLVSAPKMPASKVDPFGYTFMYLNTRITEAPALPATTVLDQSYNGMFQNCSALVYGPAELPAATMFMACYYNMFSGCTNLLYAPEIKATTLAENCFGGMFWDCSKLEVDTCSGTCQGTPLNVPESSANNWNAAMFYGCHKYIDDPLPGGHYYIKEWTGPRAVTLTSIDSTRAYDGTKLVADSVVITGGLKRSKIQFELFASQTEVGTCQNTFEYILEGNADDYKIDTVYGTLKVDYISTTPVEITIAALEKKYDGAPLEAEYSFTGVVATDSVALKLDTTTLTDAGIVAVKAIDCKIMRGETNVTNGYIVKPVQPGSLEIKPREITITSATDSKLFDMSPLTNDKITFLGDGFVQTDTVTVTVQGSQTKVGRSDNTFTYLLAGGAKEQNYTITTEVGTLVVYNPIHPVIEGMYDQWNIVLDQQALIDTLQTFINGVTLLPENVTWYVVNGEADKASEVTGAVENDEQASPATGFYHTEGKAMNNGYYCVVKVPEAESVMGISYFQSNVVFIQTPAPTTPIRKTIQNGQLIIIKDDAMYNAQGIRL